MAEFHGRQVLKAAPDKSIEFCHVLKQQFLLSDDDVGCCFHSILSEPEFIELKNWWNSIVSEINQEPYNNKYTPFYLTAKARIILFLSYEAYKRDMYCIGYYGNRSCSLQTQSARSLRSIIRQLPRSRFCRLRKQMRNGRLP